MHKYPSWDEVDLSIAYECEKFGHTFHEKIDCDLLFDEYGLLKFYVEENVATWFDTKIRPQDIWIKIFSNFRENSTRLTNMEKLVEFAFCLAGTSTEVERIFSLMNNIWDDNKSRLDIDTLNAILTIQYNSNMSCLEFFECIKGNTKFLFSALSEEKYNK